MRERTSRSIPVALLALVVLGTAAWVVGRRLGGESEPPSAAPALAPGGADAELRSAAETRAGATLVAPPAEPLPAAPAQPIDGAAPERTETFPAVLSGVVQLADGTPLPGVVVAVARRIPLDLSARAGRIPLDLPPLPHHRLSLDELLDALPRRSLESAGHDLLIGSTPFDWAAVDTTVATDADGRFRLDVEAPDAWYVCTCSALQGEGGPGEFAATGTVAEVREAGDEAFVRLVLHPGLDLRGKVVDAFDVPVADAQVEAIDLGLTTRSRYDGSFRFGPLVPSHTRLFAKGELDGAMRFAALAQADAGEEVVLVLASARPVFGRVLGEDGEPTEADVRFERLDAEGGFAVRARGDGRFVVHDVAPVPWRVVARKPWIGGGLAVVEHEPSEELIASELTLRLRPSGQLLLRMSAPGVLDFEIATAGGETFRSGQLRTSDQLEAFAGPLVVTYSGRSNSGAPLSGSKSLTLEPGKQRTVVLD